MVSICMSLSLEEAKIAICFEVCVGSHVLVGRGTRVSRAACANSMMGVAEDEFGLRQPLVEVVPGVVSKFHGKTIDKEVACFLLKQVFVEAQKVGKCFSGGGEMSKELDYRPVMCVLLAALGNLAPRPGELLDGEDPKHKDRHIMVGLEQTVAGIDIDMDAGSEQSEQLASSFMSDGSDLSGWSFCGASFHHEDGTNLKVHEAVDVRCYLTDLTLQQKQPKLPGAVFEIKSFVDWLGKALYQSAYYACAAAMQNIGHGRCKKVHVAVLGIGWLGVAEVDPVGTLEIGQKNKIALEAVAAFKKQVVVKCEQLKKKGKTQEADLLSAKYNLDDKALLQWFEREINFNMNLKAKALNMKSGSCRYEPSFNKGATILVGKVTYRRLTIPMLRFPVKEDDFLQDDLLAISGIARILYGDRVMKWKLPAVQALAAQRQQELADEFEALIKKTDG